MLFSFKKYLLPLALISTLGLTGCNSDNPSYTQLIGSQAVVQTVAPDFSTSQVAYLNVQTQQVADGFYVKDKSDYSISTYQDELFHIGRRSIDTISKFNMINPDSEIWSFSTQDNLDSTSRNPYVLISLNKTKAYLIRYASDKVWIVNPQATVAEDFKIGELDLSAYTPTGNTNGTSRPAAGIINNGKLFIAMQRWNDDFSVINTTYVAAFDTSTDLEIETNSDTEDGLKGIPLAGFNPLENSISAYENNLYVTTKNSYLSTDIALSLIEEINADDYSVRKVLGADDIVDNIAEFIVGSAIVSATQGYFFANETFFGPYREESTLYQFNPTTGEISTDSIIDIGANGISFIGVNNDGLLWVSVVEDANPGVEVIDTRTNEKVDERLPTLLNPGVIRFIQ
jgi:hypothetical protein